MTNGRTGGEVVITNLAEVTSLFDQMKNITGTVNHDSVNLNLWVTDASGYTVDGVLLIDSKHATYVFVQSFRYGERFGQVALSPETMKLLEPLNR